LTVDKEIEKRFHTRWFHTNRVKDTEILYRLVSSSLIYRTSRGHGRHGETRFMDWDLIIWN